MTEQTLAAGAPTVADRLPKAVDRTRTTAEQKTEAKKTAAAKGGSKQKKLYIHLLVGFLMILVVITGYVSFGSASQASAAESAANQVVNISNHETAQIITVPPAYDYGQVDDLSALQAEMDAIMRQMETLQAGNNTNGVPYGNSSALNATRVQQMTTQMDNLVGKINSGYTQNGSLSAPAAGLGGGHSH